MTLCELMHKVEWADLKPYIERHLPERPETKLADYERLFERLRDTAPARWIFPVTFRFFPNPDKIYTEDWGDITHDTVDYRDFYVADHAFGASLPACLASNVKKYRLSFRDAEWAAYCVWELMRINGSRDKGDEQPVYVGGFRNRRQSWFHRIALRLNAWGCTRRVKRLAKRLQCEQESAQPDDRAMRRLRRRVCSIEAAILKITGTDMDRLITKHVSEKKMERVGNLICQRQGLLNRMFTGTPEEVERMEQVNDRLLELSRQMYSRSAALYRKVLTDTRDVAFDDDVVIEGSLKYNCDDETAVLPMSNDGYYGSDFCRMLQVIDWLYMRKAEGFELEAIEETGCKSWEPKDIPEQSDAELGFEDSLNDGTTWAEGALWHPAFEHICLCHAVHDICTHKYYSIPDLLRMNDFRCEVKVTHQHIVDQSGSRWKWWEHCSFEEFRDKLRTEAAHRPEQLRLGQYIMVRTSHLFPDTVHPSLWGGADDCFNDDDRVDAYLRRLYDTLQNGSHPDKSDYFDKASRNSHEENIKNKSAFNSVPSGFMALDRVTMGWQPSDLIIIAARPSMGKTVFALSMTRNITIDYNKPVGYFSLEMSAQQLKMRLLAAESGLNFRNLCNGQLTPDQRKHLETSPLTNAPLFIDDTPALSITEFRSKVEKLKTQHDIQLIVIDYLQLMTLGRHDNKRNHEQEIAAILCSLKAIAKEFDLPIIVLSNVYRSLSTADKRPKLSDLDYLKAINIEQNVDLVIFIHRPEYYGMTVDENGMDIAGVTELIIAKHRNGDVTDIKLRFLKDMMRFTELDGADQLPDGCAATTPHPTARR